MTGRCLVFGIALGMAAWGAEPPPSEAEQELFVSAARRVALDYAKSLPDFICTQRIQRWATGSNGRLARADTLTAALTYYQQEERHTLVAVNGAPSDAAYELAGGLTSGGEFGDSLKLIFEPDAFAEFRFSGWTEARGRPVALYSFRLDASQKPYALQVWDSPRKRLLKEFVGLRGQVWLDRHTHAVLRMQYEAEGMPAGFPVRFAKTTIDYDYAEIGGRRYLLPSEAILETRTGRLEQRNEVAFLDYRKFASDANIKFTDAEPRP